MQLLRLAVVVVVAVVQILPLALRVDQVAVQPVLPVERRLEQELQAKEITAALVVAAVVAQRLAAVVVLALLVGLQPVY